MLQDNISQKKTYSLKNSSNKKKKHIPGSFWQNKDNKDKLFCNFDIFFSPNVCGKSASVLQLITVVLKANG